MTSSTPGRPTPQGPWNDGGVVVITGIQAAGRSAVAQAAVEAREAARRKTAYGPDWTVLGLDGLLRDGTRRDIGQWPDTSRQTVDETVEEILGRAWTEGGVG
ncbi:hypothetical protein OG863_09230 [Streptomyces decoyicus]|uniref:Uncharacterized protein n=1 Tax=Streptomyces decoyicus TaxID=249567 RepID=A0ABZ1FCN0_9ACTN|nr:hypothetical protein [Streptomyces decoyicus]WSB68128.1 hypothetical protein OG863_09230 [Streptomyces decoyicus]